jgi:signal transduction histidine kinase
VDNDWKIAERDFVINYSGLGPGHYRFVGSTIDGSPGDSHETILNIYIAKPWWQTWWSFTIAACMAVVAIVAIIRLYYHRKLEKQKSLYEKQQAVEQERTRIAMEMHDDLGSGLTTIRYLAGGLGLQAGEGSKEKAEKIATSAKSLVDNMNDIIWSMKSDNSSLSETMAYIRKQAAEQLETAEINYSIDFPKDLPSIKLSNELKRNLLLIAKEAIHNIVKHSSATEVSLTAVFNNGELQLKIMDNGKGIDLAEISHFGNGMKNMRKRAEEVKARFEILNAKGTTVVVTTEV